MHSLGGPCGDIHLGHFKKTFIELNAFQLQDYPEQEAQLSQWDELTE